MIFLKLGSLGFGFEEKKEESTLESFAGWTTFLTMVVDAGLTPEVTLGFFKGGAPFED